VFSVQVVKTVSPPLQQTHTHPVMSGGRLRDGQQSHREDQQCHWRAHR